MIHEVSGDILLTKAQLIAHGVAANDPMTQGLALSLHEKYPSMHKDFHHWRHQNHPDLGDAWMWGGAGGVRIVNIITQEGGHDHGSRPGKASLKGIRDGLKALARIIKKEGIESLAAPRIGAGVGGLDWADVKPIFEDRLGELDIPVYIYEEFQAGVQADEPDA